MGSLQVLTEERDKLFEQAKKLDEAVVVLGGASAFGNASPPATSRRRSPPRAPSSAAAEAKRRTRINTSKVDHFVLQTLIDTDEDFLSGKEIIDAVQKNFNFEINGIQMRASIKRLTDGNKAEDNGEQRAKKAYHAIVNTNDITFSDDQPTITTAKAAKKASSASADDLIEDLRVDLGENDNASSDTGDDVAGALDDKGTDGLTAKNLIVMALSVAPKGLALGDLVKKALATFPGKYSESTLKNAVSQLAKSGDIAKRKKGNANIYLLQPQAA